MDHQLNVASARAGSVLERTAATVAPRFLLVDDHTLVRHGLALLIQLHYPRATVFEAGSLAEAMQKVQSLENLSAVLFDLQMSDTGGLPGIETMLQLLDGVPLVVISGTLDAAVISACIRAGVSGFLSKDCDLKMLEHVLPVLLGGGIYASLPSGVTAALPPTGDVQPISVAPPSSTSLAMEGLTKRQREILALLLKGLSNKEIAHALGILEGTVKVHLRTVMIRLGVHNRTQLALKVVGTG